MPITTGPNNPVSCQHSVHGNARNQVGPEASESLSSDLTHGHHSIKRVHNTLPKGPDEKRSRCIFDKTDTPSSQIQLNELKAYQCKSIASEEVATNIRLKQERLAEGAFSFLDTLNNDSKYHIRKERNDRVRPFVEQFQQFYKEVALEGGHINAETLSQKQKALYTEIHQSSRLYDAEKIGLEYAIGLVRLLKAFDMNLDYAEQLAAKIGGDAFKSIDFASIRQKIDSKKYLFSRINTASESLLPVINEITKIFTGSRNQEYWQSVRNYFENNPHKAKLASVLVSMQFIPEDLDFLSIAQLIHWNGVGGVAKYPSQPSLNQLKKTCLCISRLQTRE